jgi:hypothetical protein
MVYVAKSGKLSARHLGRRRCRRPPDLRRKIEWLKAKCGGDFVVGGGRLVCVVPR